MNMIISSYAGDREIFVQHDPDNDEGPFAVYTQEFQGEIGVFKYHWLLEYMERAEVESLRDALTRILELVPQDEETQ